MPNRGNSRLAGMNGGRGRGQGRGAGLSNDQSAAKGPGRGYGLNCNSGPDCGWSGRRPHHGRCAGRGWGPVPGCPNEAAWLEDRLAQIKEESAIIKERLQVIAEADESPADA